MDWLGLLDGAGVPVFNDSELVRWNSDKRYLLELRERGVAIVPSQVAAGAALRQVITGLAGEQVVIKPTVGASAHHSVRGTAGDDDLDRALAELPDGAYLVQPFQPEVVSEGEWSLMFIEGEFSHAVLKRPAPDDYRVQDDFGGRTEVIEAPDFVVEEAAAALAALKTRMPPLYARVDGIVVGGRFLLMELELIEPYMFLPQYPAAVDRLAQAVHRRLDPRLVTSSSSG
jgi:glutathione synthase/RimK-type ligase-like ATP-grasp enzyme